MGGKAAILLVLGFSMIFLVVGHNFNNLMTNSLDNYFRYYNETNAYNLAVSGANMAAAEIFFDNTWDEGYSDLEFNGGELNVYVDNPLGSGSGPTAPPGKVIICHIPPGNPSKRHTIMVSQNAVAAHLAHGDYLGHCATDETTTDPKIRIVSEAFVTVAGESVIKSVVIELSPSKFSKYAYFQGTASQGIWWTSGDTVYGPMHVQGDLQVANSPVFWGKVTSSGGLDLYDSGGGWKWQQTGTRSEYREVGGQWEQRQMGRRGRWRWVWVPEYQWVEVPVYDWVWVSTSSADPKFYGGYESGINRPLPDDGVDKVEEAADNNGARFTGQDTVIITFKIDSLNYKFTAKDPTGTTVLTSEFTPNGVIFADNATMRLSGIVSGQYTIGVDGSEHQGKGNIYLDDDIVYNLDPRLNVNSPDLLGIVAENNVLITDNTANQSDINIHGSIYSENGGFGSENYSSRGVNGSINLLGGIIQYERLAVGTFSGGSITNGFNKKYKYDERLYVISPPFFPGTGAYEIVSWYE